MQSKTRKTTVTVRLCRTKNSGVFHFVNFWGVGEEKGGGEGEGRDPRRQSTTASLLQYARNTAGGCLSRLSSASIHLLLVVPASLSLGSETHVAARSFVALYKAAAQKAVVG